MTQKQKKQLRTILASLVLPILYIVIVYFFPRVTFSGQDFVAFTLSVIGVLIGGWNARMYYKSKHRFTQ